MWPFGNKKLREEFRLELQQSEQRLLAHFETVEENSQRLNQLFFPATQPKPEEIRFQQIPNELRLLQQQFSYFQKQLKEIHFLVSQMASVTPDGKKKRIHDDIEDHIQILIRAAENIGTIHSSWLEEREKQLIASVKIMQKEAELHNQGQEIVERIVSDMRKPDVAA